MKHTAVITGATSGIGVELAKGMLKAGFHIGIVGRDAHRTNTTRLLLLQSFPEGEIDCFVADLSEKDSVIELAQSIKEKFPRLDVLLNNAGAVYGQFQASLSGWEKTMATNHFGPYALTLLLLPLLRQSPHGRIILTGSAAQDRIRKPFSLSAFTDKNVFNSTLNYSLSKLCNSLFTRKLSQLLDKEPISVNCFHPGLIRTDIGVKHTSKMVQWIWKAITTLFGKTTADGARTGLFLALDNAGKNNSGKFWDNQKIRELPRWVNQSFIDEVWKYTEDTYGIRFPIPDTTANGPGNP